MAYPTLKETQGSQSVFSLFDHTQRFTRDGTAVFDAGGKAGGSGLVPDSQPSFAGQIANVLLSQAGRQKRSRDVMLSGGCLSGPEISLIVEVDAVDDRVEPTRGAEILHHREKFIFAVEAALAVIASILGTIQFGSRDYLKRNLFFVRESYSVCQLRARKAGRIGDDRQHIFAQNLMCGPGQVGGIDAAGVSDEDAS